MVYWRHKKELPVCRVFLFSFLFFPLNSLPGVSFGIIIKYIYFKKMKYIFAAYSFAWDLDFDLIMSSDLLPFFFMDFIAFLFILNFVSKSI